MITGIILASGFSNRMGKDKLLIEIEGEKTIERVINACIKSKLDKIIIIYRNEKIKHIANRYGIKAIQNNKADRGQSESMKIGIRNTGKKNSYMFIVGDQPYLDSDTINRLIKEYKDSKSTIAIPYYRKKRGMPLILSNIYRDELLNVSGDKGGRDVIKRNLSDVHIVNIDDEKIGIDIDSIEDLNRLRSFLYDYTF
ncbi:MAG: nucleotidyltransferase family protein [Tissierella sp.]|uniref:nucleotidyltransferase family protein n=1 Tax=Tissierella sp. TaxID=41274 RepID=UPI003F963DCE